MDFSEFILTILSLIFSMQMFNLQCSYIYQCTMQNNRNYQPRGIFIDEATAILGRIYNVTTQNLTESISLND